MIEIRLKRDNNTDLVFTGRLVARVTSDPSEFGGRWTELKVYETRGGQYVSQSLGLTEIPGEHDRSVCLVSTTLEAAAEFFKVKGRATWLSREMYKSIGKAFPHFVMPAERVE